MAIHTQKTDAVSSREHPPTPRSDGVVGTIGAFFAAAGRAFARLFGRTRAKSKPATAVPVIHEEVTLTPEGAAVWQDAMDPNMPVGKPVHHQRRRLPSGDATP
jgi:hypothetical protein